MNLLYSGVLSMSLSSFTLLMLAGIKITHPLQPPTGLRSAGVLTSVSRQGYLEIFPKFFVYSVQLIDQEMQMPESSFRNEN
jgi:hypothetical protein